MTSLETISSAASDAHSLGGSVFPGERLGSPSTPHLPPAIPKLALFSRLSLYLDWMQLTWKRMG